MCCCRAAYAVCVYPVIGGMETIQAAAAQQICLKLARIPLIHILPHHGAICLQVTEMKKVVQQKQVVVAQAKHDCEELLVEIVQDKRVADEQEKQVRSEGTEAMAIRHAMCLAPCKLTCTLVQLALGLLASDWLVCAWQQCVFTFSRHTAPVLLVTGVVLQRS